VAEVGVYAAFIMAMFYWENNYGKMIYNMYVTHGSVGHIQFSDKAKYTDAVDWS